MNLSDKDTISETFADFAFNVICILLFLSFLLMLIVNPKAIPDVNVKKEANYIIEMTWPEDIDCDVDIWVRGPDKRHVSFNQKSLQLMHIERDDMGITTDSQLSVLQREGRIASKENREVWTLRGPWDGEYVVNAHLYNCKSENAAQGGFNPGLSQGAPVSVPVRVKVIQINPRYRILAESNKTFDKIWQEFTMIRFTLSNDTKDFTNNGDEFVGVVKLGQGTTLQ